MREVGFHTGTPPTQPLGSAWLPPAGGKARPRSNSGYVCVAGQLVRLAPVPPCSVNCAKGLGSAKASLCRCQDPTLPVCASDRTWLELTAFGQSVLGWIFVHPFPSSALSAERGQNQSCTCFVYHVRGKCTLKSPSFHHSVKFYRRANGVLRVHGVPHSLCRRPPAAADTL